MSDERLRRGRHSPTLLPTQPGENKANIHTDLTTIQDDPEADAAGSQVADPRETEWWRPFELFHDGPQVRLAAPRIDT